MPTYKLGRKIWLDELVSACASVLSDNLDPVETYTDDQLTQLLAEHDIPLRVNDFLAVVAELVEQGVIEPIT